MIPESLEEITLDWLTGELAGKGAWSNDPATSLEIEPIGAGVGFVGALARLRLRHRGGTERTLIAKLASPDPTVRRTLHALGLYRTEAGIYGELAPRMGLATPRCYFACCDPLSGAMLLLLEDLADGYRFGDAVEGCSPDDALLAVRGLAAHHAEWWTDPRLAEIAWLPARNDGAEARILAYRSALPLFERRWADLLSPELIHVARLYGERLPDLLSVRGDGAWTFVHGDYRLDNMAFPTKAGGRLTVFDWATAYRGQGADDLSYFIVGSCSPERRRADEPALLDAYHAALCAHGVRDYGPEDLLRDYRHGLSRSLSVLVIAGGVLDLSHPRGRRIAERATSRIAAACVDHGYADLLRTL